MEENKLADWELFGGEARRSRLRSGLSLREVSQNANISISMLSKIERGVRAPKRDTVVLLDQALCTNGDLIRRWTEVTRQAVDPAWYRRMEDAERAASSLSLFHPVLIPGPLQAPEYAEEVLTAGRPLDPPEAIASLVRLKKARSELLLAPGPPLVSAVIPEPVVRTCMPSSQLPHLLDLAEAGTVEIQVIPSGPALNIGSAVGAYDLFVFADRLPLVHSEHACGGELIEEAREVHRIATVHGRLQAWALSPADSIDLIRSVVSCSAPTG